MSDFVFPLRSEDFQPPADLRGLGSRALLIGAVGAIASAAGFFVDAEHFFPAYLVAWLLWFSVASGCLGLLMLHHLSGGAWGVMVRRLLEAGARTLPMVGVLSIPILMGLGRIYVWTDPAVVAADRLLQHKAIYLNATGFIARTVGILVVFSFFAHLLSRKSAAQDAQGDRGQAASMQRWSSVGLLLFVLLSSFLAIDWVMSLDPRWFSSLYGGIFVAGQALAGLTVTILLANFLIRRQPMERAYSKKHFHDYGKLLFAFVMFFTYLGISQFIIAYQGNLPEEVAWFNERFHGGWGYVAWAVLLFHFFFPFLILLSRDIKKKPGVLAAIAGFVLLMRWVDLYWQSRPSLVHHGFGLSWIDLAATVGVGGIWVFLFVRELAGRALLPVNDPSLEKALVHE